MLRKSLCSLVVLVLFAAGFALADDSRNKNHKDKNHDKATITKVDAKNHTVTVTMKDHQGKEVEKTFQLAEGATYFDGNGKTARIDAFHPGDHVVITEKDGKIMELKKGRKHAQATITKVDAKKGTVTVSMKDKNGKEVERTFHLMEDAEYMDSTGRVATLDVFRSGDEVLIIEQDGKIMQLKKNTHGEKFGDKEKTPAGKKSGTK